VAVIAAAKTLPAMELHPGLKDLSTTTALSSLAAVNRIT